jgi:hypothetical protein
VYLAGALAVAAATACKSLQPLHEPAQYITTAHPRVVYVTATNRAQIAIEQPRMSGDTVQGTWAGTGEAIAVPMSRVQQIHAPQHDSKRTIAFTAGATIVGGVLIYALAQSSTGEDIGCSYHTWPPRGCGATP